VFHRATKNAAKHEAFEILHALERKIVTRSENGAARAFTTRQAKSFDVFERRQMEIAPGERLLVTANRRGRDFQATNGELVTVSGFDPHGRIQLEDGRTLPASFRQFAHGYAVTAQRSQGKTVDAVVISADTIHKELFQVAATRGRECIAIVTGNKEALKRSIGISAQRESVTELVGGIQRGLPDIHKSHRQEALSTPAHTPVQELDLRHHAQQNPGPVQPNPKGIEYGIHT
jgi:ATP-dependent exoDNAse (exonuclease V) alpha subunit